MPAFTPSARTLAAGLAGFLAALALSYAGRYGLVENMDLGHACDAGDGSFGCRVRMAVFLVFRTDWPGLLAVAAALWCVWRPGPAPFVAALALAGACLMLFNTWAAGLALAVTALALARPARA
jgi:hypothetical protein